MRAFKGGNMDVRTLTRWVAIGILPVLVAACSKKLKADEPNQIFPNEQSAKCENSSIRNQFVVTWKDGHITVESAQDRAEFIQTKLLPQLDQIKFVEYNHQVQPILPPISAQRSNAQLNWGTTIVKAASAWNRNVKGQGVVVAVVDTGADISHPQLVNQIYTNLAEANGKTGIDDDGNGFVDDVHGWNFVSNKPLVRDNQSHGSHVSGIIAADPTRGSVQGMAPGAKILPLAFLDGDGSGDVGSAIRGIQYAVASGAHIINASWGGSGCSQTLQDLIADLGNQGVLFAAAAGNEGLDIDITPSYPASFAKLDFLSIITVGASTPIDLQAGFSNEGFESVHLLAPGMDIISTVPGGTASYDGTSMATPFVAGAAALLWSAHPHATLSEIKTALLSGVDKGDFAVISRGRLNVEKSLNYLDSHVTP